MKFVCLGCEQYMGFEKVEAPEEGRLGVTFGCPGCGARFAMVTNPGETQLVSSLGVSLGGRTAPLAPLEMTRATLQTAPQATGTMAEYLATRAHKPAAEAEEGKGAGGCPFSALVQQMGLGGERPSAAAPVDPVWTDPAHAHLERLPTFVRQVVERSVDAYARTHGYAQITPEVVEAQKRGADGVLWSAEASRRLENVPDFVRPMARREIERLARARGATTVTAEVMDEAKGLFAMG